ncbi:MAG TPA: nucleotide sugar dehydrogenase [Gaiellaceae bacterium]|nr:nucleotide sugar dehydrogenase [Gaiellaceae bacterium]
MTDELLGDLLARLSDRTAKVVVVGQGYVGLSIAIRASELGFRVVGYETDLDRVHALREGRSFVDDVSGDQVRMALESGYWATNDPLDLRAFDVAVITVPTPLRDGVPDLSFIESAARDVAQWLQRGSLVTLESTTYPGTTEELLRPSLETAGLKAGEDFFLGYSPERIDPGNSAFTFLNTPKVVSGSDERSLRAVQTFYGMLVEKTVPVGSTGEAELVKLLENTFRHVNVALVNELAVFARDLGVDIWSAIEAATTKPFGYLQFTPGPGVGGHCLPIDPSYLAWRVERRVGHRFQFVELANDVNRRMPEYVVSRIANLLNDESKSVRGARILLLGLAYKPGTSDWRESPSMVVARHLLSLGADVRAHDAHIPVDADLAPPLPRVSCDRSELEAADLTVILVDHDDLPYDEICEHAALVFDTKGCMRERAFRGELL